MIINVSLRLLRPFLFVFLVSAAASAQPDTLTFMSGEIMIGEIKSLDRSVLTMKTSYSDSDFKIEWEAVINIHSNQYYLITLSDGRRFNGDINSIEETNQILMKDGQFETTATIVDVVNLKPIDESFWDRYSASVDVGLNQTKANNLTQFNSRITMGYLTKRWNLDGSFNSVFSSQDSIPDTRRVDANVRYKLFLPKDWYLSISNDFLQNDEQKLALRSNTKLGVGNFLVRTNSVYLSVLWERLTIVNNIQKKQHHLESLAKLSSALNLICLMPVI